MPADPTRPLEPPEELGAAPADDGSRDGESFAKLRELLLGEESRQLERLRRELDESELSVEELAERLPGAAALSSSQDDQLARALAPTIEAGIDESVERDPQRIANAVYPVLGPAIRKAIAETMAGFVNAINRAIEHSLSPRGLKWRFEAWRTGVPYSQIVIKHALVFQVEQLFLIHRETGLLLLHEHVDEAGTKDPDLVSGMLTAIRDFVSDSFDAEDEGGLADFRVGTLSVLVERGPEALLAAVVRGQPPTELRLQLEETLELIHLQFRQPLAKFDGDATPLEPARPLLHDRLETILTTDRPATLGWAPRAAWLVLALVVLLGIVWTVRSHLAWERTLRHLEEAPGIVLIEAERGLGGWRLRGFFDSDGADPGVVLAESGIDPQDVTGEWQPYLSLEPQLVLARTERLLEPPPSLELELDRGRLIARGSASPRWRARAVRLVDSIPGIAGSDLSDVELAPSDELNRMLREVEEVHVLFRLGSAELDPEPRTRVEALGPALARLLDLSRAEGYETAIELVGRTDTTGTEQTNRLLSRQRADSVRDALVAAGFEVPELETTGVGMSEPLRGEDPESTSRINRSTTFRVQLRPAGPASEVME